MGRSMTKRMTLVTLVLTLGAVSAVTALVVEPSADGVSPRKLTAAESLAQRGGTAPEKIKQRDKEFFETRTAVDGKLVPRAYLKARRQASKMATTSEALASPLTFTELGPRPIGSGLAWEWGGPLPYAGRVISIATHPTIASTAYIGTALGGVWKTVNDGVTWTPLTDGLPTLATGAIALDKNNPSTVYLGTGDQSSGYFGTGVYKSTNGGTSWTKIGGSTFDNCQVSGIQVAPGNSNLVLVTAHGSGSGLWMGRDGCSGRIGVYRSTNGGTSFTRTQTGGKPVDLAVAPNDSSVWYVAHSGSGLWKSTDSGATWIKLTAGLPTSGFSRIELDVAALPNAAGQTLYAAFSNAADRKLHGFYRSNNGGVSWTRQGQSSYVCGTGPGGQCDYDLAVGISPTNPNRAYLGGVLLDRYTSGTPQFVGTIGTYSDGSPRYNTSLHADIHALAFDASNRLWAGSDGGIWRTSDGATFSSLNHDLGTALIYPGIAGKYAGPLYAGLQDNGSVRYAGSRSWNLVGLGNGFFNAADPASPSPAYTELYNARIEKHINGVKCAEGGAYHGDSNRKDANGNDLAPFNSPLVMHPGNRNVLYSGTYRIWRSVNAASTTCTGTTWNRVSQDFPGWVKAIGPAPSNTDVVYASVHHPSTSASGLWVTQGSTTWTNTAGNGLPANAVYTDIAVSPTAPGTAWVTVANYGVPHVYRTTNFGSSWTNVSGNLPDTPANAIAIDNRTSPATLFVGSDVGVFWSEDGGATWLNATEGLPNAVVSDILLDTSANQLLVGTWGRGMWAAPLDSATGLSGDTFASAAAVTSVPFSSTATSNATATHAGEPDPSCTDLGKTLWWRYTPTETGSYTADTGGSDFDTALGVWQGTSQSSLTEIGCDDDSLGGAGSTSRATVTLTAGTTYYFQVGGWRDAASGNVQSGSLRFNLSKAAPTNNAFAAATAVTGVPYSRTGQLNNQADTEAGEPTSCGPLGKTLWWKYTPTTNGRVRADTTGSNFDTVLAAYTGSSLTNLSQVACNDDAGGVAESPSMLELKVVAGQTYYFQVGGWKDGTGAVASGSANFRLARVVPGDSFAAPLGITALPYSRTGVKNTAATTEAGERSPSCGQVGKTIWWRYRPASNVSVTATTAGSGFDTVLGIWRGTSLASLVEVGCDDDAGGSGSTSATTVTLQAGQRYYFQVGGYKATDTDIKSGSISFAVTSP